MVGKLVVATVSNFGEIACMADPLRSPVEIGERSRASMICRTRSISRFIAVFPRPD